MFGPRAGQLLKCIRGDGLERRGTIRFRLRLAVAYSWKDETGVVNGGEGQSRDVSSHGIYVQSRLIPPLGAYIEMNVFLLQSGQSTLPAELHAEGRIVRIESGSSSSEMAGFAAMNHTVILRNSQGRVVSNPE
jgi:hypothetical protein